MNEAIYKIKEQTIKDIANAIRAKAGKNNLISPLDMAEEILNLPLGDIDFSQQTATEENVEEGYTFFNKYGLLSTGTGGGINFKVIGGTTQPTNPKENTIWVNTDTYIYTYSMINTLPTWEAGEGAVCFTFGAANAGINGQINLLNNNEISIKIGSCYQYIGGQWVKKEVKIYSDGEWKDCELILMDEIVGDKIGFVTTYSSKSSGGGFSWTPSTRIVKATTDYGYTEITITGTVENTGYSKCLVTGTYSESGNQEGGNNCCSITIAGTAQAYYTAGKISHEIDISDKTTFDIKLYCYACWNSGVAQISDLKIKLY